MKKLIVVLMVFVLIFSFAGCNNEKKGELKIDQKIKGSEFETEDLANYLYSNIKFDDYMENVDEDILMDIYGIDESYVDDASAYFSTGATAEEITVITAEDEQIDKAMSAINEAYSKRIESQKECFEDYVPEEMDKLSNPLIMEVNNSLVMVICNDPDKAKDTILEYFN